MARAVRARPCCGSGTAPLPEETHAWYLQQVAHGPQQEIEARFRRDGRDLFVRAAWLLGDGEAALRSAEALFVRLLVHAQVRADEEREAALWIWRAATNDCVRRLATARGTATSRPVGACAAVDVARLAQLDEAAANAVLMATIDGASSSEIAEVLRLDAAMVEKKLAASAAAAAAPSEHPSRLALARDAAAHAEHVERCELCGAYLAERQRLAQRFDSELAAAAWPRVVAAVRAERARLAGGPGWPRALWLGGALIGVAALALVVARPPTPEKTSVPYAGDKGASRARIAGLEIRVRRGAEVRPLKIDDTLSPGDRLHFRARTQHPRFLELRARTPAGDVRIFPPSGTEAALVAPGHPLATDFVVPSLPPLPPPPGPAAPADSRNTSTAEARPIARSLWIVGLFSDRAFPLDRPPTPTTEVVTIRADFAPDLVP